MKTSHALSPADHIISKAGIGLVETVQRYYQKYQENPDAKNSKAYCLWRLRLHRRLRNDRGLLEAVNEARGLGLYDENPGPTCFDLFFD